jgi:hypothetical protein
VSLAQMAGQVLNIPPATGAKNKTSQFVIFMLSAIPRGVLKTATQ